MMEIQRPTLSATAICTSMYITDDELYAYIVDIRRQYMNNFQHHLSFRHLRIFHLCVKCGKVCIIIYMETWYYIITFWLGGYKLISYHWILIRQVYWRILTVLPASQPAWKSALSQSIFVHLLCYWFIHNVELPIVGYIYWHLIDV